MATVTARELNNDLAAAKRRAALEPVIVTDRGEPAFVLLSIAEYRRLQGPRRTLVDILRADDDIEFDPPKADLQSREVEW